MSLTICQRALTGTACVTLCAVVSAASLHGANARSDAALLVPLLWAWGALALLTAWTVRHARTLPLPLLLGAALVVRAPLVGTPLHLSDDLYRYLFEGVALNAGHNPFIEAPATVVGLHDDLRALVNHPLIPSIYPPLALWWFRLLAVLGATPISAQVMTGLTDLVTLGLITQVLTTRGQPAWPALLYALHPLPALESTHGAHLDVVAVCWSVAAIWLHTRDRPGLSAAAMVLGAATKVLPATFLPPLFWRDPRRAAAGALMGLAVAMILAAPVLAAGPALFDAATTYARHWSFNGLVFPWLEPWLGASARAVLVAIGAAITLATLVRERDPVAAWAVVGGTFVLLSPTVHPWYVLWALVPSLLAARWGWALAAVALLGSYSVLAALDDATGSWSEAWWVWWLTWPPALLGLALAHRYDQLRSEPTATEP